MFFDYYSKIVAEQRKEIENQNNETETELEKGKKLAKKKQAEVFNDVDDNEESTEKEESGE